MNKLEKQPTKVESYSFMNSVLVGYKVEDRQLKWLSSSEDLVYQDLMKNISIGSMNTMYIKVNEIQSKRDEYNKIIRFLGKYIEYYAEKNKKLVGDLKLKFINYGKTELVYVLTDKDKKRITLLVKQPAVRLGDVYQEMQYLLELNGKDGHVITPIDYFQLGDQELYVTPYINQARCIASVGTWGIYIPEPFYRFKSFTQEQESIVNTCMISKLVSLYDFEKQEGISHCKLGGGDFMLQKGWETSPPTIENTLNQLYLISARKKVKCSFEEYLQLIKKEFSQVPIDKNQSQFILNVRGRVPIQMVDIDNGINLGKSLINYRNQQPSVGISKIKRK